MSIGGHVNFELNLLIYTCVVVWLYHYTYLRNKIAKKKHDQFSYLLCFPQIKDKEKKTQSQRQNK